MRSKLCFDFYNQFSTKSNMHIIAEKGKTKVNKRKEKKAKQRERKKKEEETNKTKGKNEGGRR